jgi:methylmalonyl-CoA mutase N-terminal domain/subunit
MPKWNSISISGYHIREAGATAAQELAFTLRDGIEYVQAGIDAGLEVDRFVPRMSFFFDVHSDFFEEIAKFRAARRIWAHVMRERFGARDDRSLKLRFHSQTAGVSLTARQPMSNVMRTHQASPSSSAGQFASPVRWMKRWRSRRRTPPRWRSARSNHCLRNRRHLHHRSFAGSCFVERLTRDLEDDAERYFRAIDGMGAWWRNRAWHLARNRERVPLPAGCRTETSDHRRRERIRLRAGRAHSDSADR